MCNAACFMVPIFVLRRSTWIQFGLIIPGYVIRDTAGQLLYGVAALAGWLQILQLLRVNKTLGIKVIIMQRVAVDFAKWGVFWAIVTIAFSMILRHCFKDADLDVSDSIEFDDAKYGTLQLSGVKLIALLVRPLFGEFREEAQFDATKYPSFTRLVYYFYMFVMQIGMVNILIALLSKTFTDVESRARPVWAHERIKMILMLEKSALGFFLGTGSSRYQTPWHKCPHIIEDPDWKIKETNAKKILVKALAGAEMDANDARWQKLGIEEAAAQLSVTLRRDGRFPLLLGNTSEENLHTSSTEPADKALRKAWLLAQSGPELFFVLEKEADQSEEPLQIPVPEMPASVSSVSSSEPRSESPLVIWV